MSDKKDWRDCKQYRAWQAAVVKRDGKCMTPGCSSASHLEAHHLDHASFFPEGRFLAINGKAMCSYCHSNYHNNYHASTKEKCTGKDWLNFWSLMQYAASLHKYKDEA